MQEVGFIDYKIEPMSISEDAPAEETEVFKKYLDNPTVIAFSARKPHL
jgi:hypothetical protein